MAVKYPELELYETGRMETIIEILKKDGVTFPPPATEQDFGELYIDLKAYALPHECDPKNPLPKDFINFLKRHNGFVWNGIEIYGADKDYEPIPGGYILKNIVSMNNYLYELNPQFGELCGSPLLFIGRSDEDIFLYNDDTDTWEVRDRTDREVYETYDSFPAFFAGVVGGRLGMNNTKE